MSDLIKTLEDNNWGKGLDITMKNGQLDITVNEAYASDRNKEEIERELIDSLDAEIKKSIFRDYVFLGFYLVLIFMLSAFLIAFFV